MTPELHRSPDSTPASRLTGKYRYLLLAALSAGAISACSDDGESTPPPKGWGCVSVLNQDDIAMKDCTFAYEVPAEGKAKDKCEEGQLFVYGSPGTYSINTECLEGTNKLAGHINVDIDEGVNDFYETRLIKSLCYNDEQAIVTERLHKVAKLGSYMGRSTETRCANWFDEMDERGAIISALNLDCTGQGADCDPIKGRDYLTVVGEWGQYSNGEPIHLHVKGNTELVPPGQEVTVWTTIRELEGAEQQIKLPVIVRGDQLPDGGAGGLGGAGGTGGTGGAGGAN